MLNWRNLLIMAAIVLAVTVPTQAAILYLTDGDSSVMYTVNLSTGLVENTTTTFSGAYPIAVVDTIRLGHLDNGAGQEFDLDGNPTGVTWPGGSTLSQLLDGTTDGSTYNYAVTCCGSDGVYRFDRLWGSLELLFLLPTGGSGITYDPVNETLWIATFGSELTQYDLSGNVLSTIDLGGFLTLAALAYDGETDSFWAYGAGSPNFYNFDRDGNLLGSVMVTNLAPNNAWGGEIAMSSGEAIPEPGTWALAVLGLSAIALVRRKQKRTAAE